MTNAQAFQIYFDQVETYLKEDATSKNQKMPQNFRQVNTEEEGILFGAAHLKYLVFGRGPGKFPPPDVMLNFVENNPDMLADAQRIWRDITNKSLAYIIGRSISLHGTAIFRGDKPGIDFVGATEKFRPELLKNLVRNEAIKVQTLIHTANR